MTNEASNHQETSLLSLIKTELAKSVARASGAKELEILKLFEKPKQASLGDISLPCFALSKALGLAPQELAQTIEKNIALPEDITTIKQAGPFLNFTLNYNKIANKILASTNKNYTSQTTASNKSIIVEYSSPNIAKPFHVGHLRATLIGNALDRMYRFSGYEVSSINHLGDWGTQFGYVWAGCKLWGEPENFTVRNLVELYKKATSLKDEQEKNNNSNADAASVLNMARNYFLDLEAGKEEAVTFWKRCVAVSLDYLKATYDRLGISFDHYLGESYYSDKLQSFEEELGACKLLVESEGAKGVDLGEALGFARISTPDGRSLYLTRDLAAAEYRFKRFNFAKALYVVGSPQALHFKQMKAILEKMNKPYAQGITHIAFGHVLGMKTRGEGSAIELNDFLDEAFERALSAYHAQVSKRPEGLDENEVASKVAKSAILFSTLNRTNIKDVQFSWDDALSFQGDSGPYLLYAYARINGIVEKAKAAGIHNTEEITSAKTLQTIEAQQLLKCLLEFDSNLESTITSNEPLQMCNYTLDLAKHISKAYMVLKVVGEEKETASSNLALFVAAKNQLGKCFKLLGFEPLERM